MLQTLNNQGVQRVVRTKSSQNMYEVYRTFSQENPASLEEAGLIHRSKGKPGYPSRTYVKVCVPTDSILSRRQTENYPSAGQDSFSQTDRKLSGNKNYTTKQYNQRYRNAYSNRPQVRRTYECREGESL